MSSDTPRTDAYFVDDDRGVPPANWQMADFARQLERENSELREDAQMLDWLQANFKTFVLRNDSIIRDEIRKAMNPPAEGK